MVISIQIFRSSDFDFDFDFDIEAGVVADVGATSEAGRMVAAVVVVENSCNLKVLWLLLWLLLLRMARQQ